MHLLTIEVTILDYGTLLLCLLDRNPISSGVSRYSAQCLMYSQHLFICSVANCLVSSEFKLHKCKDLAFLVPAEPQGLAHRGPVINIC